MSPLPLTDRHLAAAEAVRGLVDLGDGGDAAFFSVTQWTLRSLLGRADLLDPLPRVETGKETGKFSRRLIFSEPLRRFGIWAIDWPPGCGTPVHNHHCSCAYGIYRGSIEEIVYSVEPTGDGAVESARWQRGAGYVGGALLAAGLVHEMLNRGADPAVSIHVYGYRPDQHADSIDRCFTAARPPRSL
jgi:predicted metal-dependent enzyme (double-stranded beta helix superfamily)